MKKNALFSIVLTTHRRPKLLERALLSLAKQTFKDFEIILAADESSMATRETGCKWLGDSDTFLLLPDTKGPASTRNAGIHHAKGKFILFLDDDDTFDEKFLENIVENKGFIYGAINYVNYTKLLETRSGTETQLKGSENIYLGDTDPNILLVRNFIPNNAFVYSTEIAKNNPFDTTLSSHEDWDYLISLFLKYEFNFLNIYGPIVHVNEGESRNNDAKQNGGMVLDYLSIYRKWPSADERVKLLRKKTLDASGINLPLTLL